jgi:hypothetical protein
MPPRRSLRIIDQIGRQNITNFVNNHVNRITTRANVHSLNLTEFMNESSNFSNQMSLDELHNITELMVQNYNKLRDITNDLQALGVNVESFISLLRISEPIIGRNINVLNRHGFNL